MYEWGRNGGFTGTLVDNQGSGTPTVYPAFVINITVWGANLGAQEFNSTGRGDAAQMTSILGDEYGNGFFTGNAMPDRIGDKSPIPDKITDATATGTIKLQLHNGRWEQFTAKLTNISINANPEGGWLVQGKFTKQSARTSDWGST